MNEQVKTYTVQWMEALSKYGKFLNPSMVTAKNINQFIGHKYIRYTNVNGEHAYANPYIPNVIVIKAGTELEFGMITEINNETSEISIYEGKNLALNTHSSGISAKCCYPVNTNIILKAAPEFKFDNSFMWSIAVYSAGDTGDVKPK